MVTELSFLFMPCTRTTLQTSGTNHENEMIEPQITITLMVLQSKSDVVLLEVILAVSNIIGQFDLNVTILVLLSRLNREPDKSPALLGMAGCANIEFLES